MPILRVNRPRSDAGAGRFAAIAAGAESNSSKRELKGRKATGGVRGIVEIATRIRWTAVPC